MVSLESIKGAKGYIVVFTCNSCPVSIAYEDRIIDLHKKYAPMGYPVVAINPNDPDLKPDDSFEEMKVRALEKQFPFVYLFDVRFQFRSLDPVRNELSERFMPARIELSAREVLHEFGSSDPTSS